MENKPNVFPEEEKNSEAYYNNLMKENREKELEEKSKGVNKPTTSTTEKPIINKPTEIEPDYNSDYDLVPLPSKGKTYPGDKERIMVSFLNGYDENILTNPHLMKSGKFLDTLFKRKIIDRDIKYEDLLVGDRDAIMLWLRATAYGNIYPIQVMDPDTLDYFDVTIDLSTIKTKELLVDPNENGLFEFKTPSEKYNIQFRLLTVGDLNDIEAHKEKIGDSDTLFDLATFTLKKIVMDINGETDKNVISNIIDKMRLNDVKTFKTYINSIECGMDLNIEVETPGGSLVSTFFPFNTKFFWPES